MIHEKCLPLQRWYCDTNQYLCKNNLRNLAVTKAVILALQNCNVTDYSVQIIFLYFINKMSELNYPKF